MLYFDVGPAPAQLTDSPDAAQLVVTYHAARMALELNSIVMRKPARNVHEDRADTLRSDAINAAYSRILGA